MLHATRMGRASPSADPIITAAFAARRILAAAVGRSGDRTLRRDRALTVYWKGQEEPGLLLYGLRRPDQDLRVAIREVFPGPAEVSEPWRLHGEEWAVDLWTVRSARLRAGDEWRATLEAVLDRLLRSGYAVAWCATEGDFVDPPDLLDPSAMGDGVYAAASRPTGFLCRDDGYGELKVLTDADLERLRRPAAAIWSGRT